MATQIPARVPDDNVRGWTLLAEQRRAHYEDLYRSGRWQLYYSEIQFRIRVRQAVALCDAWRAVAEAAGGRQPEADDRVNENVADKEIFRLAELTPAPLSTTSFRSRLAGLEPRYSAGSRAF